MRNPTLEEAFHTAIVDGINIFVREAIKAKGLFKPGAFDQLREKEMLDLKHKIAQEIAHRWGACNLNPDGTLGTFAGTPGTATEVLAAMDSAPQVPAAWVDELEQLIAEGRRPPTHSDPFQE